MEENDYDKLRQKNISERNNILADLFGDIKVQQNEIKQLWGKQLAENIDVEIQMPKKRRKMATGDPESFSGRGIRLQFRRTYNIRSRKSLPCKNDGSAESGSDSESNLNQRRSNRDKLTVMFSWAKPVQRPIDLMNMGSIWSDSDEEDNYDRKKRKRRIRRMETTRDSESIPNVDDITQDMLDNIVERSSQKTYCKVNGTSCHQCRQKTKDTKTVCRSESCVGVRGQFCGPCLQGRYGESAVKALKDPNWICPPCRDLCNCSICRTKNGRRPTGILLDIARKEGYASVMEYLQANSDSSE